MTPFWEAGELSVREAADRLARVDDAPDYSTVQTIVGRLEKKDALKRVRKIGNAWIFEAAVERKQVVGRLIDEIVKLVGGASNPIMSYLVESDRISREDLEEIKQMIAERESRDLKERRDD